MQAFRNCSALTNIAIPNNITNIEEGTFYGCKSLTNITIPEGAIRIGNEAFSFCSNLTSITVAESVTNIDMYAFSCCSKLENITIPKGVSSISIGTFYQCTALKEMIIPYTVNIVNEDAFDGCKNLTSLTIYNRNCSLKSNSIGKSTTIYGFSGSTAEAYSKSNGNSFVSIDETHEHVYDGIYDGQDAITVNLIAYGMLTREQVGEAVWMAADCNHDDVIDNLDVNLLNRAGLLLSKVDQSKTDEELSTDSAYTEYLSLIDQKPNEPDSTQTDNIFLKIIEIIKLIIKFIEEYISKDFVL